MLKNAKAKGSRAERRAIAMLESIGYLCTRSGGSLGCFDVVAIGPRDIRCLQVKSGARYLSVLERERLQNLVVPSVVAIEIWRFPDRCREPLIERI